MTMKPKDKDYCGLGDLNTGPNDPYWRPACRPHDKAFQAVIDGDGSIKPLPTFIKFVGALTQTVIKAPSLWTVGLFIPYLVIGGLGGIVRQQELLNRLSGPDKDKRLYEGD